MIFTHVHFSDGLTKFAAVSYGSSAHWTSTKQLGLICNAAGNNTTQVASLID